MKKILFYVLVVVSLLSALAYYALSVEVKMSRKTPQKAVKSEKESLDDKRAESFLKSLGHGKSMIEIENEEGKE